MVKRNHRRPGLKITGGGTGIANHAGTRLLADLADRVGLTDALSTAMAPTKQRRYRTKPHSMGRRKGFRLDNVQEVLSQLEGEEAR